MDWFYLISHPFMSPTQLGDPPRHPPMQHHDTFVEPDVAQHTVVTMAMNEAPKDAHADIKQSRHVVVKYIFKCDCCSIYVNIH